MKHDAMHEPGIMQHSASDSASDDSEAPEAVELEVESSAPIDDAGTSCVTVKEQDAEAVPPAPVTIITGCLGAGKTTLVHNILTGDHGLKIAVFMNEYGEEQDMERQMLSKHEGEKLFALEEWVELANGCLCCSLKDDFLRALEALMEQRQRFDYIIVETTGLADPGPIASALWVDAELHSSVSLDSIVTVVDAHHLKKQLQESRSSDSANEAERQIAFADTILLNKVDLVDADRLAECSSLIRSINADATIQHTQQSSVNVTNLLNQGVYSQNAASATSSCAVQHLTAPALYHRADMSARGSREAESSTRLHIGNGDALHSSSSVPRPAQHATAVRHDTEVHSHNSRVSTMAIRPSGSVNLQRLRLWLEDVLWEGRADLGEVYRLKGVVEVEGSRRLHVVQAVRELYDIVEGPERPEGDALLTRLVLIGRDLQREKLLDSFNSMVRAVSEGVETDPLPQRHAHGANGHDH